MIPVLILSDKMRPGVSLAMYIILSVLHRNTLDEMRVTTVESDMKSGLSQMSVIIACQCITLHYLH